MAEMISTEDIVNVKRDLNDIGECINGNETGVVNPRLGDSFSTLPAAIAAVENKGGYITVPNLAALNAIVPEFNHQVARTDDTGNEYRWNPAATPSPKWEATGKNYLNDAKAYADANPLFKPIVLGNENLNDIKVDGLYVARGTSPSLARNYPVAKAGYFLPHHIVTGSTGTLIPQTYMTFDGEFWTRGTNSNGDAYTAWTQLTTSTIVNSLIANAKNPTSLTTDSDIRALTTSGTYSIYSNPTTPTTTSNLPKAGEQYLVEFFITGTVKRMIAYARGSNEIYVAWYWGTFGWSAWERLATEKDISSLQSQITAIDYVKTLHEDLKNPFKETRIKLIGDSITWGMGGSAGSPIDPRNGDLTDVRNTIDTSISKTWANLFRTWLAKTYGDGTVTENQAGSGYTINKIRTTWSDTYKSVTMLKATGVAMTDTEKLNNMTYDSESSVKFHGSSMRLVNQTVVTARPTEMTVNFYGDNIAIDYEKRSEGDSGGDIVEVYLDGTLHGTFNYYSASAVDATYPISTTIGQHTLRFKNISTNSASYVNIYGFAVDKKIYVANDGIIGSSTKTWIDKSLYEGSLHPKDDFVLHMLGTNDRATGGSLDGYKRRIRVAMDKIKTLAPNAKVILMASTYANNESEGTYKFHMKQVSDVNAILAKELNVPFIDHYKYCAQHLLDGEAIWSDGLHLNDLGNKLYFLNILNVLFKI